MARHQDRELRCVRPGAGGLEGLIHISELSHQRVAHPGDVVHEGQTIKLKVISLDSERHRLGLSLKQAEEAPHGRRRRVSVARDRACFDASQAVQEPEGGIDNTLAAAFAQVRAQVAQQESARAKQDRSWRRQARRHAVAADVERARSLQEAIGRGGGPAAEDVAAVAAAEDLAEAGLRGGRWSGWVEG